VILDPGPLFRRQGENGLGRRNLKVAPPSQDTGAVSRIDAAQRPIEDIAKGAGAFPHTDVQRPHPARYQSGERQPGN